MNKLFSFFIIFDPNLLNIDEASFKSDELVMYDIKYIKNWSSLNYLYLVFNNLDTYIEKSGENKFLIFSSTEKNKMMLKNYTEVWDEIKEQTEFICDDNVWIAPAESRSVRGASHQPIFMGDCLTICHTYLPCLPW